MECAVVVVQGKARRRRIANLFKIVAQLPAEVPLRIVAQGATMAAAATRLEDFALALEKRKGRLELVVEKGRLRVDAKRPQGQIKRLSARLDGEARFRIKPRFIGPRGARSNRYAWRRRHCRWTSWSSVWTTGGCS